MQTTKNDAFESHTVVFDEIVEFVKKNCGKKLDLSIKEEDSEKAETKLADLLCELSEIGLPEESIILRLPSSVSKINSKNFFQKLYDFFAGEINTAFIKAIYVPEIFIIKNDDKSDNDTPTYLPAKPKPDNTNFHHAKEMDYIKGIKAAQNTDAYNKKKNTTKKSEKVNAAVFAPGEIKRKIEFSIKVSLYKNSEHQKLLMTVIEDKTLNTMFYTPQKISIPLNSEITIRLQLINPDSKEIIHSENFVSLWKNKILIKDFICVVPMDYDNQKISGLITIFVNKKTKVIYSFTSSVIKDNVSIKQFIANLRKDIMNNPIAFLALLCNVVETCTKNT